MSTCTPSGCSVNYAHLGTTLLRKLNSYNVDIKELKINVGLLGYCTWVFIPCSIDGSKE